MRARQCSMSSSAVDRRAVVAARRSPSRVCTHFRSGTPITAPSATAGALRMHALDLGRIDVLGGRLDHAASSGPTNVIEPSASRRPRSLVWCQPPRERSRVLVGPVPVAVHHRAARGATISPVSPAGTSLPSGSTMRTCSSGDGAAVRRRSRRAPSAVERQHADDLGLPVAAGLRAHGLVSTVTISFHSGAPGARAGSTGRSGRRR